MGSWLKGGRGIERKKEKNERKFIDRDNSVVIARGNGSGGKWRWVQGNK